MFLVDTFFNKKEQNPIHKEGRIEKTVEDGFLKKGIKAIRGKFKGLFGGKKILEDSKKSPVSLNRTKFGTEPLFQDLEKSKREFPEILNPNAENPNLPQRSSGIPEDKDHRLHLCSSMNSARPSSRESADTAKFSSEKLASEIARIFKSTRDSVYQNFSKNVPNQPSLFYTLGNTTKEKSLQKYQAEYREAVIEKVKIHVQDLLETIEDDLCLDENFLLHLKNKMFAVGCDNQFSDKVLDAVYPVLTEKCDAENSNFSFAEIGTSPTFQLSTSVEEGSEDALFLEKEGQVLLKPRDLATWLLGELKGLVASKSKVTLSQIRELLSEKLGGKIRLENKATILKLQNSFQEFFAQHFNKQSAHKISSTVMRVLAPNYAFKKSFA